MYTYIFLQWIRLCIPFQTYNIINELAFTKSNPIPKGGPSIRWDSRGVKGDPENRINFHHGAVNFSRRRPHRFAVLSSYLPVRSVVRRGAQEAFSIGHDIPRPSARLEPHLPDGTGGQVLGAMDSHRIEGASAI